MYDYAHGELILIFLRVDALKSGPCAWHKFGK